MLLGEVVLACEEVEACGESVGGRYGEMVFGSERMEVVVDEGESFNEVLLDAVVYVGEVSAVVLGLEFFLDINHVGDAGD